MKASYYRDDLALIHHQGYGAYADEHAPAIVAALEPVRGGTVLELGCGSGALTRHLVHAGHHVIATDASTAFLDLVAQQVPEADVRRLILPDDPLPEADAVVSTGHVLSYLDDEQAVTTALAACADALRPGGLLAIDLADRSWIAGRTDLPATTARMGEGWAIISQTSSDDPGSLTRTIATFVRSADGSWRRDDEVHHNTLLDASRVPALLAAHGVEAEVRDTFGTVPLPLGVVAVVGRKC